MVLLVVPLVLSALATMTAAGFAGVSLLDSVTASRSVTQTASIGPEGTVDITATRSGVVIEAGPEGQVSVTDSMKVRTPTRALARQALDTFRRSSLAAGVSGVGLAIPPPEEYNPFAFSLDREVTVKVPAGVALRLRGQQLAVDLRRLTSSRLDVQVSSGAVRLKDVVVSGSDKVTTTAGAIDFEGSLVGGSLDLETSSGAINVTLPPGSNLSYDVATGNGALFVRPAEGRSTALSGSNRSATGVIGDGSAATLRVRAGAGAVAVYVKSA